jgi:MFS family permease
VAGIALPSIMKEMGVTAQNTGFMVSSAPFGMMFGAIFLGTIADRIGLSPGYRFDAADRFALPSEDKAQCVAVGKLFQDGRGFSTVMFWIMERGGDNPCWLATYCSR